MTLSVVTTPTRPIPGREVSIAFGSASGNWLRLWCTSAPEGSALRQQRDALRRRAADAVRVDFFEGPVADPLRHTFDVGGMYTFVAQEYTRGASAYGGGYEGAPDARASMTKVGAEQTFTVAIGTRLGASVGCARAGLASLVLWAWDDTVHATNVAEHGEFSPALTAPTTPRARAAIGSATIQALLDALDGEAVADLLDVGNLVADMRSTIAGHIGVIGDASFHEAADTENAAAIEALPSTAGSYASIRATHLAARTIREALDRHMRDRDAVGAAASSPYHQASDLTNEQIADAPPGEADPIRSLVALADAFEAFEAHRVDDTAHAAVDGVNVLTAGNLSPLMALLRELMRLLRGVPADAPPGEHEGVVALLRAGFRKT